MVSLIFVIRPLFPGILGSYPPFQQGAVLVCAVEQQRALLLKYSPSGLKLGLDNVYSIPPLLSFQERAISFASSYIILLAVWPRSPHSLLLVVVRQSQ